MNNPVSTYRIQFHKEFTFDHFREVIPYLHKLGVKTIYASPIFEAVPGSVHGYDGVNPHKINPEVGTEEQLLEISARLKELGISWLQDIVPNHMAFDMANPWLQDVLEKGHNSVYASYFDVPWNSKIYSGKIMIPFLGSHLNQVIKDDELRIQFDEPRMVLKYYDTAYPLRLRSYFTILNAGDGEPVQAIQSLIDQVKQIQQNEEPVSYKEPMREFQMQLAALAKNEKTKDYIKSCIDNVNNNRQLLREIVDDQFYQLCEWQKTDYKINFRRFFTVNGLICLNIQTDQVFKHYHKYIKTLLDKGVFQGLRIDHIDGLYNPTKYLQQLRELVGDDVYIVVEKILEPGEGMPEYWPIQGNTGYDFLSIVNNVLTNKKSEAQFTEYYKKLVNDTRSIHQQLHDKKSYILHEQMGGELTNLHNLFVSMNLTAPEELAKIPEELMKEAIAEFLIQCPVYRYYGNALPLSQTEAADIQHIFNRIVSSNEEMGPAIHQLEEALLVKPKKADEDYKERALRFYQRLMQFTGPLMAKGVEDTLMYTYNRFIGHNEVGDSPEAFGDAPEEFHRKMVERQQKWPYSMNGTSTHDTKRGEDVRARLNVLTNIPAEWIQAVEEWRPMNAGLKQHNTPDTNDEYLIYQTVVGASPMPGRDDDFERRIQEFLQKALREAKLHSNWTSPDEAYEQATKSFATQLLDRRSPFQESFEGLFKKVVDFGIVNSLAQVVLKFTCPGIPDLYQGTELWDFSLVDPDNRRLIDYKEREKLLNELEDQANEQHETLMEHLWQNRYSAKIKLWLTHQLLNIRKDNQELFTKGEYIPLDITGAYKDHVMAFARKHNDEWIVVAIPLHIAALTEKEETKILSIDWNDTVITIPAGAPSSYNHLFSRSSGDIANKIAVKEIFKHLPLAVLKLQ